MTLRLGVNHRHQLGDIKRYEVAVEIGTHRGFFAEQLVRVRDGGLLYCVDPWRSFVGYEDQQDALDGGGKDREDDLARCKRLLDWWINKGRVKIFRAFSVDAARTFNDNSVDLVYIDGDHRYLAVKADLELWWPKLRSGGILAGHDFICPGEVDGGWGQYTQRAVLEFSQQHNLDVFLVPEFGNGTHGDPWSYYMEKP